MAARLEVYLDKLTRWQNADGGWGYFPGRGSWMEPTFYAAAALMPTRPELSDKAFALVRQWQQPDGSVSPSPQVKEGTWVTALWVSLHCISGRNDEHLDAALDWMLRYPGAEGALWRRIVERTSPKAPGTDNRQFGWSWFPGTNSWVEPTVHGLVALRKAFRSRPGGHPRGWELRRRVRVAEKMLLDRVCDDGGWNYGARSALGIQLSSYPECTGIALLGLQGIRTAAMEKSLARAQALWHSTRSPLARAWLAVSLRLHGVALPPETVDSGDDVLVTSLFALTSPGGNLKCLEALPIPKES